MDQKPLLTIDEFRKQEPYLGSEQAVRALTRSERLRGCVVRIGRRVFIDSEKWQEFRQQGGRALAGGWRKESA